MRDENATATPGRKRLPVLLVTTGLLLGGAAVGAVGVAAASAAPETTTASPSPSASSSTDTGRGGHGRGSGETEVTGAKAATLKAAAVKAVPGGTVLRVETDADGAAYEVHVRKSDGTRVTVKFDAALKQTAIETDTGKGGHGRGGDRSTTSG